jgi:hypothetical protein
MTGDPRPSLEERYGTKKAFLEKVRASVDALVAEGYLLEADARAILESSSVDLP